MLILNAMGCLLHLCVAVLIVMGVVVDGGHRCAKQKLKLLSLDGTILASLFFDNRLVCNITSLLGARVHVTVERAR
jgi:hypothetical protein